jgi:imidazolonepropionase-like amidohydrolase
MLTRSIATPRTRVLAIAAATELALLAGAHRLSAAETPAAPSPPMLYRAAAIYTGTGSEPVRGGGLLVRNGKVVRVLQASEPLPVGVDVTELDHAVIIPGLVAAGGLFGPEAGGMESGGAEYQALDDFDFYADHESWLGAGVTTIYLDPGRRRLISGVGAVVKLGGEDRKRSVMLDQADLRVNATGDALRPPNFIEPPLPPSSDNPITPELVQRPTSRLGVFLELNDLFVRANALDLGAADRPMLDVALLALKKALERGLPVRVQAERADEIRRALQFGAGRRLIVSGATEAQQVAAELKSVPVVLELPLPAGRIGPNRDPAREPIEASMATAATLEKNGVRFALAAESGRTGADPLLVAGMAVGAGLSPGRALAAITSDAAAILGVGERVGTLAPDHDADFVVLTGEPFAANSSVLAVYVDGRLRYEVRETGAVVVRAGHVLTLEGPELENGAVVMKDGKVQGLGRSVSAPAGASVEDFGPDAFVVPGFIDAMGHLGLNGERARVDADAPIDRLRAAGDASSLEVARAGVTTTIVAPYVAGDRGARAAALKTAGNGRDEVVVDALCGIVFPAADGDVLGLAERYKPALDQGKEYFEKWRKYEEDLKKWEEQHKPGAVQKKEDKPAEGEPKKESRSDSISGKWEATITGGQGPEPQKMTLYLRLDGTRITGRSTSAFGRRREGGGGGEVSLTGTLEGDKVTLEFESQGGRRGGGGRPRIEAKLDKPDHMTGTFGFGNFQRTLEATRTEKGAVDVLVVDTRRKKGKDDRPPPPPVDEKLEPYRRLYQKEIPAIVPARGALEIRAIVKLFVEQYGLPLVLVSADQIDRVQAEAKRSEVSVVAPTSLFAMRDREEINVAADLIGHGFTIAFQSDAENAAQDLPAFVISAVHAGLDPGEALRALTINPARMYKIDDRVGSLRVGKDADLLVFSGTPLAPASRLLRVYVGGREVYRRPD